MFETQKMLDELKEKLIISTSHYIYQISGTQKFGTVF